jgi:hypothetical protein
MTVAHHCSSFKISKNQKRFLFRPKTINFAKIFYFYIVKKVSGNLVRDIPAGDGKTANLFYIVLYHDSVRMKKRILHFGYIHPQSLPYTFSTGSLQLFPACMSCSDELMAYAKISFNFSEVCKPNLNKQLVRAVAGSESIE